MPDKDFLHCSNFDELRQVLAVLPECAQTNYDRALARWGQLAKPAGSLGKLETAVAHMAGWQDDGPHLDNPRIAVFAGNHGVTRHKVSAYPASVTSSMVKEIRAQRAAINCLATTAACELNLYEMDLANPTADSSTGSAMDEAGTANAICYGMLAVTEGVDCIAVGEIGIGNSTAAAALTALHLAGDSDQWCGPGSGLDAAGLAAKRKLVKQIVARHAGKRGFAALAAVGGKELAAIAGAIIGARMARSVVLIDGYTVSAVALALQHEQHGSIDHCLFAHQSAEPGHAGLLAFLQRSPLLNLELRLGEGSGAALAIPLLRAGVACYHNMAKLTDVLAGTATETIAND